MAVAVRQFEISSNCVQLFRPAFAVILEDGSVLTPRNSRKGGDRSALQQELRFLVVYAKWQGLSCHIGIILIGAPSRAGCWRKGCFDWQLNATQFDHGTHPIAPSVRGKPD